MKKDIMTVSKLRQQYKGSSDSSLLLQLCSLTSSRRFILPVSFSSISCIFFCASFLCCTSASPPWAKLSTALLKDSNTDINPRAHQRGKHPRCQWIMLMHFPPSLYLLLTLRLNTNMYRLCSSLGGVCESHIQALAQWMKKNFRCMMKK